MTKRTSRMTKLAVLTALALILSLVESMLPPLLVFAPGTKLGLANVCILAAIVLFGLGEAATILVAKCLLAALFAGNPFALVYALPAGLVSLFSQYALYRFLFPRVGLVGISLVGASLHNMVQLVVASLVLEINVWYLLPLSLVASVFAGLFIGFTVWLSVRYLPKHILGGKA